MEYEKRSFSARTKKAHENFERFLKNSARRENRLHEINWQISTFSEQRLVQTDTRNCRIFIIHYINALGRKEPTSEVFQPNELRIKIAETLIAQSEDITRILLL